MDPGSKAGLNFTGQLVAASKVFGPEFTNYVVNYGALRKQIPNETSDPENHVSLSNIVSNFGKLSGALAGMHHTQGPSAKFVQALDVELRRVVELMTKVYDETMLKLYDEYDKLRKFNPETDDLKSLQKHHKLDLLGEKLKLFEHFQKWNEYAFRRLAMKFDEYITRALCKEKTATNAWISSRLKETLNLLNLEGGLVLYSMCHHLRRQHLNLKSSTAMGVNMNLMAENKFKMEGKGGFETGADRSELDEVDLYQMAAETGIKLGPQMEEEAKVRKEAKVLKDKSKEDAKKVEAKKEKVKDQGKEPIEPMSEAMNSVPGTPPAASPPTSPRTTPIIEAKKSIGPLGGPSLAPPLDCEDLDEDDASSMHEGDDTTSMDPAVASPDTEIIEPDVSEAPPPETTPLPLSMRPPPSMNGEGALSMDTLIANSAIASATDLKTDEAEKNAKQRRCTRRMLVPPDDSMCVKVTLCRYLGMLNFTVEMQVLRYYKLLLNLKEKHIQESGPPEEGVPAVLLSEVVEKNDSGPAKFGVLKPSKGLASCSDKKRNIHMAFMDSQCLQGYRDLLADSEPARKKNKRGENSDDPGTAPSPRASVDASPYQRPSKFNSTTRFASHTGADPEDKGCRKTMFRDKARLWRLRWSDNWVYSPEKLVLIERIDYADADSKSRSTSGQTLYSDCPGGTFRDPACPGSGEHSIPTIEDVVEEGLFSVGLEARDLKSLLSSPESFDPSKVAEYYATYYCKTAPHAVVVAHYKKVLEAACKAVVNYGIKPVLQTWGKRDMFVFTDPTRDPKMPVAVEGDLTLQSRVKWSHAADSSSSTVVMMDEDVAYVNQYDAYFDCPQGKAKSPEADRRVREPVITPGDAARNQAIWNFPLLVVRIHGREERCSQVSALINNVSLRAAEVYGLSSYAHGIAQLVAPKVNLAMANVDGFQPFRQPSWMSFTELVQTSQATLARQMKDQKLVLMEQRTNKKQKQFEDKDGKPVETSDTPKPSVPVTSPLPPLPPPKVLSPQTKGAKPAAQEPMKLDQPIMDLFAVKRGRMDPVDQTLWTDLTSCRDEMKGYEELTAPSEEPTILAAFDSTIQNLTEPLTGQKPASISEQNGIMALFENVLSLLNIQTESSSKQDNAVSNHIVRVEPKAYFANERTLLQWMNICVLLSTISITLMSIQGRTAYIAGCCLAPIAIFFLMYSFSVYRKRNWALTNREPIKYADELGPFLLCASLVCALSIILVVNIKEHALNGVHSQTFHKLQGGPGGAN